MKTIGQRFLLLLLLHVIACLPQGYTIADQHPILAIGAPAPDFSLTGVDGKTYTLASFSKAPVLAVVFTCNHCPTAQAYENRVIQLVKDYGSKGLALVAIMPNDPKSVRLDELGYTDLSDSYEEMKQRAADKQFNFPYLYDGDNETAAKAYGPVATPHIFIFDSNRKLRYQGRIDDVEKPGKIPHTNDARNAIEALLAGKTPAVTSTKVFGCSVKWQEKSDWIQKAQTAWAAEPVTLQPADADSLKAVVANHSDKLRLINIWATWCGPCVAEYPDFININRMYRERDFEFISISADDPANKEKVLRFLQKQQSSVTNYLYNADDKYQLMNAIDTTWQGALPYTLLVEPGGKIVFSQQGAVDITALKKRIVENPMLGRYY